MSSNFLCITSNGPPQHNRTWHLEVQVESLVQMEGEMEALENPRQNSVLCSKREMTEIWS